MITTRTSSSCLRSSIARRSSSSVCVLSALRTFGRLMVTTATAAVAVDEQVVKGHQRLRIISRSSYLDVLAKRPTTVRAPSARDRRRRHDVGGEVLGRPSGAAGRNTDEARRSRRTARDRRSRAPPMRDASPDRAGRPPAHGPRARSAPRTAMPCSVLSDSIETGQAAPAGWRSRTSRR